MSPLTTLHASLLTSLVLLAPQASAQRGAKPFIPSSHGMPDVQREPLPEWAQIEERERSLSLPDGGEVEAPASLTTTAPTVDDNLIHLDRPGDGNLWVRGATYKARFGTDAVEFVPFLGSAAPRNFPVTLTLESVRVGAVALDLLRDVEPRHDGGLRSLGGDVISYDRGSVVEHYVIETDSIEQRFRFDRPLAAGGDLVIRIAVDSELGCAGEDADGFCFANELGGVRYGRAVVFDNAGLQSVTPTRLVDGGVEIEVCAAFLAQAEYPLTIDPLVSAFTIDSTAVSTSYPDVAFDTTNQVYAVVWEYQFSQVDHDIWLQLQEADGSVVNPSATFIDMSTADWRRPKVANNNLAEQFMVVATVGGLSGEIWGRTREAGEPSMGQPVRVDGSEIGLKSKPDIGGDPSLAAPTFYSIVWQNTWQPNDIDIHARLFKPDSTPYGVTFALDASTNQDSQPTISNSCGVFPWGSQCWTVAWTRQGVDADVYASQMNWNGIITEPTFPVAASVGSALYPTVSTILDGGVGADGSGPRPYLVAWVSSGDIWGRIMQASTPLTAETNLTALEGGGNQDYSQLTPCVESDGSTFVLAYAESRPATGFDIYVAEYDYAAGQLYCTDPNRLASATVLTEINPKLASQHAAGGEWGDFMGIWQRILDGNADTIGAILSSQGFGHTYCSSYSNTTGLVGHVRMVGSRSVANQTMTLIAQDCPPTKPGLFFLGTTQPSVPFGEGVRCVGGAVKRFTVSVTNSSGVATLPINFNTNYATGIVAGSVGVNYQFWFRDPAGGPEGFNLTDALHVEHTP